MCCDVHFKYQHQKHYSMQLTFSLAFLCLILTPYLMVVYFQTSGGDEYRIELGGHLA